MKKIYTLVILAGFYFPSWAQTLSPFVISSSGGFYSGGGNTLSTTVGEMTMVQTFTGGTSILTQGFQQPTDFNVGIPVLSSPSQNSVTVFPNPNSGIFTLMINMEKDADVSLRIFDAIGREVYFDKMKHASGISQVGLRLTDLIDGIYWMELHAENTSGTLFQNTQKINIIH